MYLYSGSTATVSDASFTSCSAVSDCGSHSYRHHSKAHQTRRRYTITPSNDDHKQLAQPTHSQCGRWSRQLYLRHLDSLHQPCCRHTLRPPYLLPACHYSLTLYTPSPSPWPIRVLVHPILHRRTAYGARLHELAAGCVVYGAHPI